MSTRRLETTLVRQLHRAGLDDVEQPPDAEVWSRILGTVNDYYRHLEDDRAVLLRSNDAASDAASQRLEELGAMRQRLRDVLATIADALVAFGRVTRTEARDGSELTAVAERACGRLIELVGAATGEEDADVTGIRSSLVRLASELRALVDELRQKGQLVRKLEAAALAQSLLVPETDSVTTPHAELAGACRPASTCGGDWWQRYELSGGRFLILVGDVTGHGVASSVVAGVAKAASHVAVAMGVTSPFEVLARMNAAIFDAARRQVMMTCVAALVDPVAKTVQIANAGHNFPYIVSGGAVRPVVLHGAPLGSSEDVDCIPETVELAPGDTLLCYTDGLVDSENEWGEQFGEKRLRALCVRLAAAGATAIRAGVLESLAAFSDRQPQGDDVTLVVVTLR